jgi:hypothetical protein
MQLHEQLTMHTLRLTSWHESILLTCLSEIRSLQVARGSAGVHSSWRYIMTLYFNILSRDMLSIGILCISTSSSITVCHIQSALSAISINTAALDLALDQVAESSQQANRPPPLQHSLVHAADF